MKTHHHFRISIELPGNWHLICSVKVMIDKAVIEVVHELRVRKLRDADWIAQDTSHTQIEF
jgi:hypothetical protein